MSPSQLAQLDPGDTVIFAVSGTASSGTFTKARFAVNNTSIGEVTAKNANGEFYVEYEIPASISTFSVKGEVFHSNLDWL